MEKSSAIVLSAEEKAVIQGTSKMTKTAGQSKQGVPERFNGWYSHDELKEIANEQD